MTRQLRISMLLLVAISLLAGQAHAEKKQKLHTPAEIMKILIDSKISYEFSIMDSTFPCRDRSDLLTNQSAFPSKSKESVNGYEVYKLSDTEYTIMAAGEAAFKNRQYEEARAKYLELAKLRPDYAPVLVYIGQTYEKSEDYSKAITYLEQAIDANYYDYLAHYFVADDYAAIGNYARAANEIAIASILNRNNKNIANAIKRIMPKAGFRVPTWCFEPQVLIVREDDTHISLKAASNWLGYGIAKAVWKFEPGYRAANGGVAEGSYNLAEDKECLASLVGALGNDTAKDWKAVPELNALMTAFDKKMFFEYLYYEVVLPKFPKAVYQLPRSELDDIRKYLLEVRCVN